MRDTYRSVLSAGAMALAAALLCLLTAGPAAAMSAQEAFQDGNRLFRDDLYWAALLHDVGKIAVDPFIINKPGALTDEEYKHVMSHSVVGPKLVEPFVNEQVVEIISHHHDHYDGSGHGQTIVGAKIPIGARIVAVGH